jgi:4-hydroxybenzoate polyprenyltransferase
MNKYLFSLLLLIAVSRPFGWLSFPAFFLMGSVSSGSTTLTPLFISQLLLLSFPFCIFVYGLNDIYDYESDKINPRKGLVGGIVLQPEYHSFVKHVAFFVISLLFFTSLLTLNIFNILVVGLLVPLGYFYSAPPVRFKERPPLDSIINGIGYFFAPFLLGFSFSGSIFLKAGTGILWIGVCLITAVVMGFHSYSTIIDYDIDKKIGVKTFATVFGKRSAAFFALFVSILALFFANSPILFKPVTYYYFGFCCLLFFITLVFPSEKTAKRSFALLWAGFVFWPIIWLLT